MCHLIWNVYRIRVIVIINIYALALEISHVIRSEVRISPQIQTWKTRKFNTTNPLLYHQRCWENWQKLIFFFLFVDEEVFLSSLIFQMNIFPCGIKLNTFKICMWKRVNITYTNVSSKPSFWTLLSTPSSRAYGILDGSDTSPLSV